MKTLLNKLFAALRMLKDFEPMISSNSRNKMLLEHDGKVYLFRIEEVGVVLPPRADKILDDFAYLLKD